MAQRTFQKDRDALVAGTATVESITGHFLDRIESDNDRVNAFVYVDPRALEQARRVDADLEAGADLPLAGMVLGVKDVIAQRDKPLTCASEMLTGFESVFTATAVERLQEKGAVIIGRTNCDEFAMGSSNEFSAYGPVRNPHDTERVAGGSSGGSAAAVAAGMCHVALGSDTGGSVRQPAAFCGVLGLKPTYGRVSRYGLVAFASSLDCIGPIAHTADDAAVVLSHMSGFDPLDSTSADAPATGVPQLEDVTGLRLGVVTEFGSDTLPTAMREALDRSRRSLERAGVEFDEVSLPNAQLGVATYYILACAEASSNLGRFDGVRYGHRSEEAGLDIDSFFERNRSEGFGSEVKRRLVLGTYVLSAGYYDRYYARAQAARSLIRRDFEEAFAKVDALLTPVTPSPAYLLGSHSDDVLQTYLEDAFTVGANLAGIPAVSVPAGLDADGLPIGVQLLGPHFTETQLLALASALGDQASQH